MNLFGRATSMMRARVLTFAVMVLIAVSTWGCGGSTTTTTTKAITSTTTITTTKAITSTTTITTTTTTTTFGIKPTDQGFQMSFAKGLTVEVAVQGESAFRVSCAYSGTPKQRSSPMIAQQTEHAPFQVTQDFGTGKAILTTSFGHVSLDVNGGLELHDSAQKVLVKSASVFAFDGTAVTAHLGKEDDSHSSVYYGAGAAAGTDLTMVLSNPTVVNKYGAGSESWLPQYYSQTDNYAALAVGAHDWSNSTTYWNVTWDGVNKPNWANYPARWTSDKNGVTWTAEGSSLDFYLMPACCHYDYLKSLMQLTGKSRVPPRYAFGFFAGRWGWTDKEYIDKTLNQFRNGSYPADAFITDFEFFTYFNDYAFSPAGNASYWDFNWSNITFPDPVTQLKDYKNIGFQMGGIRKPRFGNPKYLDELKENKWLIEETGLYRVNGEGRNANFTTAGAKQWYQTRNQHYLDEGVSFWWNDEGEVYFFQYQDWNQAQFDGQKLADPNKRFYTLNRAFTPGLQTFGVGVWTGDISVSWGALRDQPKFLLNYALAGNVYLGCDTGGFVVVSNPPVNVSAELLTRWYWTSAFMTIMRVHSAKETSEQETGGKPITPHFPFLYGEAAGEGMRKALEMRYSLIPLLYSLGHEAYETGKPIARPLLMEFLSDTRAVAITDQWLVGTGLMTAPVLTEGGNRSVYFPYLYNDDRSEFFGWWTFNNSKRTSRNGTQEDLVNVSWDTTPLYVRPGTILPLAPVVQHTGDLYKNDPTLEVQLYAGADTSFTLVEDDGDTYNYEAGTTCKTIFSLAQIQDGQTITWSQSGSCDSFPIFHKYVFTLFNGSRVQSPVQTGANGKYVFNRTAVSQVAEIVV